MTHLMYLLAGKKVYYFVHYENIGVVLQKQPDSKFNDIIHERERVFLSDKNVEKLGYIYGNFETWFLKGTDLSEIETCS